MTVRWVIRRFLLPRCELRQGRVPHVGRYASNSVSHELRAVALQLHHGAFLLCFFWVGEVKFGSRSQALQAQYISGFIGARVNTHGMDTSLETVRSTCSSSRATYILGFCHNLTTVRSVYINGSDAGNPNHAQYPYRQLLLCKTAPFNVVRPSG